MLQLKLQLLLLLLLQPLQKLRLLPLLLQPLPKLLQLLLLLLLPSLRSNQSVMEKSRPSGRLFFVCPFQTACPEMRSEKKADPKVGFFAHGRDYFSCSFSRPRIFSAVAEASGLPSPLRTLTMLFALPPALTETR